MRKAVPYPATYLRGHISLENQDVVDVTDGEHYIGVQIASDGRIWICIDGIAFLRFAPSRDFAALPDR